QDHGHGGLHGAGIGAHLDQPLELRLHARAEELVVVDDHDRRRRGVRHVPPPSSGTRCAESDTSVPPPGMERTSARPPARSMRPRIDSRTPRRSAGTAASSKPGPRSRTYASIAPSSTSAYTRIGAESGACFAALRSASPAAPSTAS